MIKVTTNTVLDMLLRLRLNFRKNSNTESEEPFRSELYSSDQMNRHGVVVAKAHKLTKGRVPDRLLKRLDDNEGTLLEIRNLLVESIRSDQIVSPAAEWLLDNFYLLEEQIVIARKHLPKGYSEGLPCLSSGMPRVYDIVLEIISHSDGRVDMEDLSSFVSAYQTYNTLTLGELWAIPIMLRLAVIENLRRVSGKIALDLIDHNLADYWGDKMIAAITDQATDLILVIADMARSKPALSGPFVAGLTRKLQGKGAAFALPLNWMEQQLATQGYGSDDLVRAENQKQAAHQVSVRNSIGTLRFLGATDWREFVESLSTVEQVLKQDIAGVYPLMDFATRDRYRHVVETIAKASPLSETEVARRILELSRDQEHKVHVRKYAHIGYYLIGGGRIQAERVAGMRYTPQQKIGQIVRKVPVASYLSAISLLTAAIAAFMFSVAFRNNHQHWLLLVFTGVLSVSGAAQLSVAFINWIATITVRPVLLPRMDFSEGIPANCRTLIVVPTMLSGLAYLDELSEALEMHFLANKEENLYFGLLTDFPDAASEHQPGDQALLDMAISRIAALNTRYQSGDTPVFFLFHRPRIWNEKELKWMGYERKRGKLSALNALLLGHNRDQFSVITGDDRILRSVKYVITLDSDTQLPRDAVWKFVATMAHPLNQPFYDAVRKRVTEGYAILQPGLASSVPKTAPSLYLRMLGSVEGIDPYTRVSSDVYQDLFDEGSFTGKGIYDVAMFEQALDGAFEENRILSHDLLEGCYARSGLLSDVLLYEEHPTQYQSDVKRRHRWIRGDWQIGAWMLPFTTGSNGRLTRNKLSALSRWKIADNLRRSLVPLSLLLLLLSGWTILPFPWFWTLTVTAITLVPLLAAAAWQFIHKPAGLAFSTHISETGLYLRRILFRFVVDIAVLPYEAFFYSDAIIRTNWRMIVSRRHLLEWTPSATFSRNTRNNPGSTYKIMFVAPLLAVVCSSLLFYVYPASLLTAAPILLLWLLAPALMWRLSEPGSEPEVKLSEKQIHFLHQSARKTWGFFEQFITAEDHWLPPDNFQEQPAEKIAHRTSPTNMGLALLANLTACDFGYITGVTLLERCGQTLQSMQQLERFRGHFYNWYDTQTLLPLAPRYVSTVDSGNLAGHLLTLRQGLLALAHQPVYNQSVFKGLLITTTLVSDFANKSHAAIASQILDILPVATRESDSLSDIKKHLDSLHNIALNFNREKDSTEKDTYNWADRLVLQLGKIRDDLQALIPWIDLLPVPQQFPLLARANEIPTLLSLKKLPAVLIPVITQYSLEENSAADRDWLTALTTYLHQGSQYAKDRIQQVEFLAGQCEQLSDVAYEFLLDRSTNLCSIGYNVEVQKKDDSYYDLLASEVRLGIFVAIAQGKLPQESWFSLGRLLTSAAGDPILLSWSGSMFEYLMPQLVMPVYENTLLDQTGKASVKRQIEYAAQRGKPWGISESAYNTVDANLNYQYRAFGVPGLGLKRGLEEDLVIAPYASMLALMVAPEKACANLQLLAAEGFEGEFGFYEAVDYTPGRLPRGKTHAIVQSFMVHHQGMGFLALAYLLLNKPMQQRFNAELRFQATMLLLQERIPRAAPFYAHTAENVEMYNTDPDVQVRSIATPHTSIPEIQLLSNGRYQVMITNSGGGYSRWNDIALTRWREDTTRDNHGIFCYIKDVDSGHFWSNTHQPTLTQDQGYHAVFSQGHVEFERQDLGITTKTEIVVSPEDDVEMRRVRITNRTTTVKILEVTSYAEVVMASQASDEAHPAFSNLFVQTEILTAHKAIICTRRPRSAQETPPWMFHLMEVSGIPVELVSYETDRMQFIGRGRALNHPRAMDTDTLSGKQGSVLDPVMAIRYRLLIKPGQTATVDLIYGISETKVNCEGLMYKYRDLHLRNRAFELSWTHSQVLLRQINATEADAQLYNRIAAAVVYTHPLLRADASVIRNNFRGQSGLWSHSISGDLPIVLLHIHDPESMDLVRQMVQAHAYWRLKGLAVDLVIWNEDHGAYRQLLQEQILGLITAEAGRNIAYSNPGNIYVKTADQLSAEDRVLFESVARVIIRDNKERLSDQLNKMVSEKGLPPLLAPEPVSAELTDDILTLPDDLLFFNGTGGFTRDGREYKILTTADQPTPAPWVNVLANPDFGTIVSESGSAYTWALNAHEYRLSPWNNDPVSDTGGEACYLRDEVTGRFWSPSPFPANGEGAYITTHGFGYSRFEHLTDGIASELSIFVDTLLPIKFAVLKIKNQSGRERKLTATGFIEIILGDVRSKTNMHILPELDTTGGALLFRNRYNTVFADRVAFFKTNSQHYTYTTDRAEFIGRNRNLEDPAAMQRTALSGRCITGKDTCAALQVRVDLLDGGETEIVFQLGNGADLSAATDLIRKFSDADAITQSFNQVQVHWKDILGTVQVATPDPALNLLANGWLLYQTVSSRIFARSGFYQSGGAFGFRDQLQDVLALLHTKPAIARQHILLSASRQFSEGDVQHWWHPPEGRGVRTHCSDDLLWLPFCVSRYISATGDTEILTQSAGFLESRLLHKGEDVLYDLPVKGNLKGTIYEHCVRAIEHSLRFGTHGLPLMGSGDWNDGMDRVGNEGLGESIWLGFFLYNILMRFADIATVRGDSAFAGICTREATRLQTNIDLSGWDGKWYLRAWFDDGTPLGSKENKECRIDAIAQSWSVLSGAAGRERREKAMAALDEHLVRRDIKVIQLLDPPFDQQGMSPGYIKGYVPGVRENGGQYTHAAVWALMAFADLGQREKVWELFSLTHPIYKAVDPAGRDTYKVEPYVMAADVYANESHRGRGGWTWYTGAAGWMYQFITGSLLGMEKNAGKLQFKPCFPLEWPSVSIDYHYGKAVYKITLYQVNDRKSHWIIDDNAGEGDSINLIDDGAVHITKVYIAL